MSNNINYLFKKGVLLEDLHDWMEKCSTDNDAFLAFWQYAIDEKEEKAWRALWVVEHAIKKNPKQADHIFPRIYQLLADSNNHSILRMGFKLILLRPIPLTDLTGVLLSKSEEIIMNTKMPVATRANALQFMFEFCKIEPALTPELALIMEHISEHENSSGMKGRIRHIRQGIKKINKKHEKK